MILLEINAPHQPAIRHRVERFPFALGRSPRADFTISADGVWDNHLRFEFITNEGFLLTSDPNAITRVNGLPIKDSFLRNGDLIEAGALKIRFWLADAQQRQLRPRECATWIGLSVILLIEFILMRCLNSAG